VLWDHADNDYAEALAETGLAGGLLIVCALVLFLRFSHSPLIVAFRLGNRTAGGP